MLNRIAVIAFAITSLSAHGVESIIGTTRIDVSFSGSLNTIAGSGVLSLGQIVLPVGSTLENIRITLTKFQVKPEIQAPQSIGFSLLYRYPSSSILDGAGAAISEPAGVEVGSSKIFSPFVPFNYSNPFLGLFANFGQAIPLIQGGASWPFGGINAAGSATFQIDALGSLASVPEPGNSSLLLFGLFGLGCAATLRQRLSFSRPSEIHLLPDR